MMAKLNFIVLLCICLNVCVGLTLPQATQRLPHKNKVAVKKNSKNQTLQSSIKKKVKADTLNIEVAFDEQTGTILKVTNAKKQIKANIPEKINGVNVLVIGEEAFMNAPFKEIILPKTLTTIKSRAFSYCSQLEKIQIPNTVTFIEKKAFYYCESLNSIILPNYLSSIEDFCFTGCMKLINPILPSNILRIGKEAFAECDAITEIELPDVLEKLEEGAFKGCSQLIRIKIPNKIIKISPRLFEECKKLESVTLSMQTDSIDYNAFVFCNSLLEIKLPATLTYIGVGAFDECTGLSKMLIEAIMPPILEAPFINTSITKIEVPFGSIEAYKTAPKWMRYSDYYSGYYQY